MASKMIVRLIGAAATTGALAAALLAGTAPSAAASTIGKGWVQLCAQGDYPSVVEFPSRGGLESTIVNPGSCWLNYMGGRGWESINVMDLHHRVLATFSYNGDVSGIGIGTEGRGGAEYVWVW